jgi:hypothetical protein
MTQKQIAFKLNKHRNTIYKHVKRINNQRLYSIEEIVNKIDSRLQNEIDLMSHRDLIMYRRATAPAPITTETSITGPVILKWEDESSLKDKVQSTPKTKTVP